MKNEHANEDKADRGNWRTGPHNRWAFHHVKDIIPSVPVPRARAQAVPFGSASKKPASAVLRRLFLKATSTDAIVVVIDGTIVFESYGNGNDADTPHILMSASKAVIGLLAGILEHKGMIDLDAPVQSYIPEIAHTAYCDATPRNLLDMRAGVSLSGQQEHAYNGATNWDAPADGRENLRAFFQALPPQRASHGGHFNYVSANTDLLGWVIERATGSPVAALLSELLWQPMGAGHDAYLTVDREGLARCAGGLCATARDFARIGQLMVDGGMAGGAHILPSTLIEDILKNGSADAWKNGQWGAAFAAISKQMRYRSGWYVVEDDPSLIFAMGIHGQNLFIDRHHKIVVAKFSSWAKPTENMSLWLTHREFRKLQRRIGLRSAQVSLPR